MPISRSEAMGMLDKVYGFKMKRMNKDTNKSRTHWRWLHDNRILVDDVAGWRDLFETFDCARLAKELGLEPDDLPGVRDGEYSKSCLQFVLFVHQLHRHLELLGAQVRANLIRNFDSFIPALTASELGKPCCGLLKRQTEIVDELIAHPDTDYIGKKLKSIIKQQNC